MPNVLLEVAGLRTHFHTAAGVVKAIDDVSFTIGRGETLGLVGESGCGKSVIGDSIMGLVDPPGRIVEGSIRLAGRELRGLATEELRRLRGDRIALIFDDPTAALNPMLRIDEQMTEAIVAHAKISRAAARSRARETLIRAGIPSPDEPLAAYPHQLSAAMCVHVGIAIALQNDPDLVIADEPAAALDPTVRGRIVVEMLKRTREVGAALLWLTCEPSRLAGLADRVCVMYCGRIVEQGGAVDLLTRPRHPYTRGLLESMPSRARRGARLAQIPGMAPSALQRPAGCAFRGRCGHATAACRTPPDVVAIGEPARGRAVRCHHPLAMRAAPSP